VTNGPGDAPLLVVSMSVWPVFLPTPRGSSSRCGEWHTRSLPARCWPALRRSLPTTGASSCRSGYRIAAGLLVALAVLTALTGARTKVIWFKVCPVLLASSAVLLVAASLL